MKKQQQDFFDTSHLHAGLAQRTVKSGAVTLGSQAFSLAVNLGSLAILARLLTPADFGLIAMVTALTGILALLKDAGLSMATVQQEKISYEQVSTLFWLNVALSAVLMLGLAALAPFVVWFYGEPRLYSITLIVAGLFLFDGLAIQHRALLRRQMRFGTLARIQILSTTLAAAAAIAAATMGFGYWTLLVQLAVTQLTNTTLIWWNCPWLPGLPRRRVGARAMVRFGGYLTGFQFVNYFARNADNVLIGKVWGTTELGVYTRAYSLLLLPIQQINGPISAVAIPALSRLQSAPASFRGFFRRVLSVVAFITFPLIGWMIVCRREIVLLVLGSQWEPVIPVFGFLALSAFFQPVGNVTGLLYITLGRTDRMFQWGLISSTGIVLSFLAGIKWGAIGVSLSYSIAISVMFIPLILFATRDTPVSVSDFYQSLRKPLIATLLVIGVGLVSKHIFSEYSSDWLRFASISLAMLLAYLAASFTLDSKGLKSAISFILKETRIN